MPRKKRRKAVRKKQRSFFQQHPHTRWLIPLFILVSIFAIFYFPLRPTSQYNTYPTPTNKTQSTNFEAKSRDGSRTIRTKKENNTTSLVITNSSAPIETTLVENFIPKSYENVYQTNWSLDDRFVFLVQNTEDNKDVYVYKSDGTLFTNGKKYLSLKELGYIAEFKMTSSSPRWQNDTEIIIVPDQENVTHVYVLDAEKEELRRSIAGS